MRSSVKRILVGLCWIFKVSVYKLSEYPMRKYGPALQMRDFMTTNDKNTQRFIV